MPDETKDAPNAVERLVEAAQERLAQTIRERDRLASELTQITEERDIARRDAQVLLGTYHAYGGNWESMKDGVEALQSERDSLKARLAEMEKALRAYGRHNWDCKFMRYPIYDACSCGWEEIRILINES
jgi:chromosome segregation ATPase